MGYAVKLDVFEGPLDLLLQLVSKERLDVADVSISTITEEYLRAVRELEEIDLDMASRFLILAATLLELKSIKLLPRKAVDDPELAALLEERDHLLHRLIELATFKNAGAVIATQLEAGEGYFTRVADLPPELIPSVPDILQGLTAEKLAKAAGKALEPKPLALVDTSHVTPITISVREMVDLLAEMISSRTKISFSELTGPAASKLEVVLRFLALLELFKSQSVDLEQTKPFEDIVIRWRQPRVGRQNHG